jgi:hypothetical protein
MYQEAQCALATTPLAAKLTRLVQCKCTKNCLLSKVNMFYVAQWANLQIKHVQFSLKDVAMKRGICNPTFESSAG